ncbi:MAG: CopD family protein [Alphaproteobacteria bacterium]|nr:CopD family protein [Alphaproteobacteria bacterium]
MTFGLIIHILAAILWVGGMFFAYVVLRPTVQEWEALDRLNLWRGVFQRFFPWVWASALGLLLSGYVMIFVGFGGFSGAGLHVHVMHFIGLIMITLFCYLYFVPWPAFRRAVDEGDVAIAAARLATIRRIVGANLTLGLLTAAIGASGR